MLVLGDAHADDPANRRALLRTLEETDADVALQVGDLLHYDLPVETYFIAGNNEDQDVIEALRRGDRPDGVRNVHLLDSDVVGVDGLRIAGLSGNFAPTQFNKSRADLQGDRRRHFVHADVERARDLRDIDVFLVHEAPHGLVVTEDYDVGCKHVDTILREVEPRLCLVGHHHETAESRFGSTRVVSLPPVWEAHYELDPETLKLTRYDAPTE